MLCPNCGTSNRDDEKFCRGCLQPLTGGRPAAGKQTATCDAIEAEEYAGFWRRLAALLVDGIVLWMIMMAVVLVMVGLTARAHADSNLPAIIVGMLVLGGPLLYFVGMESGERGATFGKRAVKIRVVNLDGERIGTGRALVRYLGHYLSYAFFYVGFLMQPFTPRKQALHDMVSGTLVVRTDTNGGGVVGVIIGVFAVFFLGMVIMAGVAIPAYQNYVLKAQVTQALQLGNTATAAVENYYAQQHHYPGSIAEAGAALQSPAFVSDIGVDPGAGEVTIRFKGIPYRQGEARAVILTPTRYMDGSFAWHCSATGLPQKVLPVECR